MDSVSKMSSDIGGSTPIDGRKDESSAVESMFPPTLVRYDHPVLVVKQTTKYYRPKSFGTATAITSESSECQDAGLSKKEAEEIFNAILPPREWTVDGNLWRQAVSNFPATRADLIALEEQLNTRLKQRQARQTGLCPIRRELYSQCFDEIIRQVTINCAERGLLLLRVRDEANTTMNAYRELYDSSAAFAMRKALMAESKRSDLEKKLADVAAERYTLENSLEELQVQLDEIEEKYKSQQRVEEKRHYEEIQFMKQTNQQIKIQLEGIIAPKKTAHN